MLFSVILERDMLIKMRPLAIYNHLISENRVWALGARVSLSLCRLSSENVAVNLNRIAKGATSGRCATHFRKSASLFFLA